MESSTKIGAGLKFQWGIVSFVQPVFASLRSSPLQSRAFGNKSSAKISLHFCSVCLASLGYGQVKVLSRAVQFAKLRTLPFRENKVGKISLVLSSVRCSVVEVACSMLYKSCLRRRVSENGTRFSFSHGSPAASLSSLATGNVCAVGGRVSTCENEPSGVSARVSYEYLE